MANSIALAEAYLPILDEIYKRESLTSVFDAAENQVNFINAKTVNLFTTSLDGLADYGRNTGFVGGDVNGSWESLELEIDRGRAFQVDAMDDEETLNMAFGTLSSEFIRTLVVPEVDAYRFAKWAGTDGVLAKQIDLDSSVNVLDEIDDANAKQGNAEVPRDGKILFVSEAAYKGIKKEVERVFTNEGDVRREVEYLDNMQVIRVPQSRFYTAIDLLDGTSQDEEIGGFAIPNTAYKINFMLVHPSAIVQVVKHDLPRIFEPAINQGAYAWKFDYRIYHDTFVKANKVKGIYVNAAQTPGEDGDSE